MPEFTALQRGVSPVEGVTHLPGHLGPDADALARDVFARAEATGLAAPVTPRGQPFSARQANFGTLGWISDRLGYRYEAHHPATGAPWPPIPEALLDLWAALLPGAPPPECALVNHYVGTARMGMHQDRDEAATDVPILSVSFGQPARFRIGGTTRGGRTVSLVLDHGDVLVMAPPARLAFHGVDRLLPGTPLLSGALPFEGRLSVTLRRVTRW